MYYVSFAIALLITIGAIATGLMLYWKITKKWLRYSAYIFKGIDFKGMAEDEGVKVTNKEKEYMSKYLKKMFLFGAVITGLYLLLIFNQIDMTYYEIYPLKVILSNAELFEKANVEIFISSIAVFGITTLIYPYKLAIFMLVPGKGIFLFFIINGE